ncbi:MAG: Rrf2 family transcriptional regulator [Acidimicrobiales bacterium]
MANLQVTAPLRVTQRVDYALKSVLLLARNEDAFLSAKAVADHYDMSLKVLSAVLWSLRAAGIVDSRPGWHGGFRLARPPATIPVRAVIAAASRVGTADVPGAATSTSANVARDEPAELVAGFWQALDEYVQGTLDAFTVADLAASRMIREEARCTGDTG